MIRLAIAATFLLAAETADVSGAIVEIGETPSERLQPTRPLRPRCAARIELPLLSMPATADASATSAS